MKQHISLSAVICLIGMSLLSSCQNVIINKGDVMPGVTSEKIDSVSYALGMWAANVVKESELGEMHYSEFSKAFNAIMNGQDTKITEDEVMTILNQYIMERNKYVTEKRGAEDVTYLEENKDK